MPPDAPVIEHALALEARSPIGCRLLAVRVHIISDMEGVAGIVKWRADDAAASRCTRRAASSTPRRSTPPCAARRRRGATEIVVMDCHGAGKGLDVQLARSPSASTPPASSSSRTSGRSTRSSSSRAATPRSSSACTRVAGTRDGVMNHTVSGRDYQNLWFNGDARRRDGDQRGALRHVGLPGAARHRRRGLVPRGDASCSATA